MTGFTLNFPTMTDEVKETLSRIFYIFYLVLITLVFVNHEPWGDEYQGWMRAQALSTLQDFFIIPGGEGHPPLWYWILHALGRVTDFNHARYLTLLLAGISGGILYNILKREPFLLLVFLLSGPVLSWWTINFRSYSLVLCLVLGATLCFRSRKMIGCTICLGAACMTHLYAFVFLPLFIGNEYLRDRTITILKLSAVPALLILASIYFSGQGNQAIAPASGDFLFLRHLATSFMPQSYSVTNAPPDIQLFVWGLVDTAILGAIVFTFGLNRHLMLLCGTLLCLITFFSIVYCHNLHHVAFATFLIMAAALMRFENIRQLPLAALLAFTISSALMLSLWDIKNNYSNAKAALQFLRFKNGDEKILALDDFSFTAAVYGTGMTYYSLAMARETDGLIAWTERKADMAQYQLGYEAAGRPEHFILISDAGWVPSKYRMHTTQEVCDALGWDCQLKYQGTDALYENLQIYYATAR